MSFLDSGAACLNARVDALFELTDALLCADGTIRTLVGCRWRPNTDAGTARCTTPVQRRRRDVLPGDGPRGSVARASAGALIGGLGARSVDGSARGPGSTPAGRRSTGRSLGGTPVPGHRFPCTATVPRDHGGFLHDRELSTSHARQESCPTKGSRPNATTVLTRTLLVGSGISRPEGQPWRGLVGKPASPIICSGR